jgi:hypothetical protein
MNKQLLDKAIVFFKYRWPHEDDNFLRFDAATERFFTYGRNDGMIWKTSIYVCDKCDFQNRLAGLKNIPEGRWYDLENGVPISLPPIGTECEVRPQWDKVKIVAYDENRIVYWNFRVSEYKYFIISDVLLNPFRPLDYDKIARSDEKKRVVDCVFESLDDDRKMDEYNRILIEHLYDAIKQNNFK